MTDANRFDDGNGLPCKLTMRSFLPLTNIIFLAGRAVDRQHRVTDGRSILSRLAFLLLIACCCATSTAANEYVGGVRPYLQKYCVECHNSKVHKGELDLARYTSGNDVTANFRRWNNIIEFIRNGEMPPEDARQPGIDESNDVVATIENILLTEAIKHAGDPGAVLPRRLSNTEYDAAIRDLTGVDIRPTEDFPADPAGGEGFDNTGEALRTSPNLVKKYLAAAQSVADHLVLKPDGIFFAPYPVTSYNERKKLVEQAIIDFYESHSIDTLRYLDAAWRYRYRGVEQQDLSIEQWADWLAHSGTPRADRDAINETLSRKYLALVWQTLNDTSHPAGFFSQLTDLWNSAPAPAGEQRPAELLALRDRIEFGRRVLAPAPQQLIKAGAGNWPISHLDFRAKTAAARDKFDRSSLQSETLLSVAKIREPKDDAKTYSIFLRIDQAFADGDNYVVCQRPLFSLANRLPRHETDETNKHKVESLRSVLERFNPDLVKQLGFGRHPAGGEIDAESFVIKAPAVIEIPLTVQMQRAISGKQLLVPCQLDREYSGEGSVFVQHSLHQSPQHKFSKTAEHLIYRDSEAAAQLAQSASVFCRTFPNRFFYIDKTRGLAAGFHLVEGFFRDDQPLVQKVLSDSENAELDRLWQELDFVTQRAETLLRGFVWFERSEREVLHDKRFDFLRAEDPQLIEDALLSKFEKLYLDKLGIKRAGDTLAAQSPDQKYDMVHGFFERIRDGLKRQQDLLETAQQRALSDMEQLAARAYRRPLSPEDRQSLHALYRTLREEGQSVEASIRGVWVAVLMSPQFGYHWSNRLPGAEIHSLEDHDLASRLSFFLWSSLPDEQLLAAARQGTLQQEDELVSQTRRMLKDDRIAAFAREFFGQWLRYRDYLAKDPINAAAFPGYDDQLRESMFAEPVRLATHLIQTDQPVTELISSDMTFVNHTLAKHYGGAIERQYKLAAKNDDSGNWYPVTGLREAGRGGLLGMGVILAKNSAGQRTSPVKRGFWSVHHLLGQHFPPPPADVPELPASEEGAVSTIRELLSAHVADAQCAMCHSHFDSLGLAMEGFDPIGRSRSKDRAGRPIDDRVQLPNGKSAEGIPGLVDYIQQHRRQDFVNTLCRKFLGYALGRSVSLSDQPLLSEMEQALEQNEFRFSVLFESVVRSPQFRKQRGRDFR
jgi:hypothetical protein